MKFVAGVIGPSTGSLSSPKTKTTWDQMVNGYRPQAMVHEPGDKSGDRKKKLSS
jgi:methionine synthase I (cobalamin-dependent)